jgi:phospholipase/carboxylesterase
MTTQLLDFIEVNPQHTPTASVIWLHGLGADGYDFANIVPELNLPANLAVRFVFPHAPVRPITINNGYAMRAWYDILGFDKQTRQDANGIRESEKLIHALIKNENTLGIPSNRIILGGFSQGGAVALHTGLRYPERLAGVMALSTYLPFADDLAKEANSINQDTPIFIAHGTEDAVLPYAWGQMTNQMLHELKYPVEFHSYNMPHSVCGEEIKDIGAWLTKALS